MSERPPVSRAEPSQPAAPLLEELVVDRFDLPKPIARVESGHDRLATLGAEASAPLRVPQQTGQRFGERDRILRRHENPGAALGDELDHTGDTTRHDRHPKRHGLGDRKPKPS